MNLLIDADDTAQFVLFTILCIQFSVCFILSFLLSVWSEIHDMFWYVTNLLITADTAQVVLFAMLWYSSQFILFYQFDMKLMTCFDK